ncbi:hypothetical protein SAMN05216498_2178 [Tenuibacillus multivorans]|uniref:Uncharacterized protein n=2 Tax=Tenuibacillus multivorans TaxID=237069 RepID=A0A1H0B1L2_9BACI|nr:hypothetical protein SAMN05216498_2178 [Tenuibacillus multivorans]
MPCLIVLKMNNNNVYDVTVNEEINRDEFTLNLMNFESFLYDNYINIHYEPHSDYELQGIFLDLKERGQYPYHYPNLELNQSGTQELRLSLGAFDQVPDKAHIEVYEVQLKTDEQFAFKIDTTELESNDMKEYEQIDEIFQTEIRLAHVKNTKDGLYVTLRFNNLNEESYLLFSGPRVYPEDSHNYLTVTNESGERHNFSSFSSSRSENRVGFTIPKEFVEESEEITVELSNLLYGVKVDEMIEIPLTE